MAQGFRRLRDIPVPATEGLWTPQKQGIVRSNYAVGYLQATDQQRSLGAQFYPRWNADAQHLGERLGGTTEHGAAVLAHLSPANEAEQNRIQAYQLVHLMEQGHGETLAHHIGRAAEHVTAANGLRSQIRYMEGRGEDATRLHEQLDHHVTQADHHRQQAEIKGTPLGSIGAREINNAIHAATSEDPMSTLESMKISDFGHTILHPEDYPHSPMDTHYHDLGVGRTDIPYNTPRGLGSVGRYRKMQELSQQAHQNVAGDVSAGAFMGGGWYHQQHRKVEQNPHAAKARLATETKIARMVNTRQYQPFLPTTHGMPPAINTYGEVIGR